MTTIDVVLIDSDKEAEFKMFTTEDLIIRMVRPEVSQATNSSSSPSLLEDLTLKAPATVDILSAAVKVF